MLAANCCQNLVRKALYFNYDRYKEPGEHAFKNEERVLRRHVSEFIRLEDKCRVVRRASLHLVKHIASTLFAKS